ncbi:MAG: hypothetical protein A2268_12870 [Candidatus Raymondbacteria bacterium RifOxyA12_full_50_37]|uniref:Type II secretion system protein GspG C-terminal domain-containing protein n=1 Tax=Candidatus Raymondbacteria bacterium RIFOXYD12_FULL_49_13 TaxID=1817890 RepID=A0A1F7FJ85_UNCRA|nr:MAG: hypothetical protein A2268_12870 [Candidatus Raymondbacteria bacterium RifOxyA12_full_50_37]OGJ90771.1 MAG: hypothetical protein A2248_02120 [Candidatus Raymondbacteria bacterium RIFOXYA2_FULL_49_16]OGJ91650.1 MAG: hypothetical protein A2350_00405 [Candidatus Raymondbacteria bacterium RifOxyB12_full_50_8]OGJ97265.1 MAG: hypothetical protein A2487_16310 [Candidatus Raymondbacteria bacterium RifOxyC12_full_50_8]OGJ97338.1 MAG: hypothetical protein A2453_03400 [Candidatus Raymondbacteria b
MKKKKHPCRSLLGDQSGFTLTELVVAIAIIGILTMLAIPRFLGTTTQAKVVEFKTILTHIHSLEEAYYIETESYAPTFEELNFAAPDSKYFIYSIEGDSAGFLAKATVKINLKDGLGNNLKDEYVTINQDKERGGTQKLRAVAKW